MCIHGSLPTSTKWLMIGVGLLHTMALQVLVQQHSNSTAMQHRIEMKCFHSGNGTHSMRLQMRLWVLCTETELFLHVCNSTCCDTPTQATHKQHTSSCQQQCKTTAHHHITNWKRRHCSTKCTIEPSKQTNDKPKQRSLLLLSAFALQKECSNRMKWPLLPLLAIVC